MTICEQLSERMPAVALGQAAWSDAERAHLAACAECGAEWALVSGTSRLGLDIAAGLDGHHITERVLGRLRIEGARARVRRVGLMLGGLAAAAALTLVVWPARRHTGSVGPGVAVEMPLPELDSLGTPELQAVLDSLDTPLGTMVQGVDTGDLDDLNAPELQHVLDGLEG
jgi:anti-sigma factor RsiW